MRTTEDTWKQLMTPLTEEEMTKVVPISKEDVEQALEEGRQEWLREIATEVPFTTT